MIRGNRQRIVGATVFCAVALILLPMIFDGQGSYESPMVSRIPVQPQVNLLPEPRQIRPVIIADSPILEEETSETEQAIVDAPPTDTLVSSDSAELSSRVEEVNESPVLDQSGLPRGWSIRLGSFAEVTNANNLVDRLRESGYKAYTKSISNGVGDLTSVLVGPWIDRVVVDEYQQELQDEFMLPGDIVLYEINQ
ncbi:SPOR domain-containing protein [Gammaproteobacteria bacterium]|nr:SPOR domain-containing protein [Gammaproteobacteria bacterium]